MMWGVREQNDKDWTYTEDEVRHTKAEEKFIICEPVGIDNLDVSQMEGTRFEVSWNVERGCLSVLMDHYLVT